MITGNNQFENLENEEGVIRILKFYEEVCVAYPAFIKRLIEHDIYLTMDMEFEQKILRYLDKAL